MISGMEIREAVKGSWLLFCNRPEGIRHFDVSLPGFWRSFLVLGLLLPFFVVSGQAQWQLMIAESELPVEALPLGTFWLTRSAGLIVEWLTLPLLLAALAGWIGIGRTYVPFIIVRNWSALLISLPYAVASLAYLLGIIPSGFLVLVTLSIIPVMLWFQFRIARHVAQVSVSVAIGLVILDTALSLVIGEVMARLFQL
ncbi:hypothetical protein [Roseibium aestuarii]|nr:hypothetical protein [Roseibium aestuarii]